MRDFLLGVHYFMSGFGLIAKPGIKRFVILPLFANIIFFSMLFLLFSYYFNQINQWLIHFLPNWLQWVGILFWGIFFLGFAGLFAFTFIAMANLIAAPFNGLLSEKIEYLLTGKKLADRSTIQVVKDTPRMVARQLAILLYYLPRAFVLLVLFFVPIIQLVAFIIWFLFSAWFVAMTFIDYPTDNHQISFASMRDWLHQRRFISLGFGISVLFFMTIPIVNFFVVPAAVAGATHFWLKENT